MLHQLPAECRHCRGHDVVKNGHRPNGSQGWRCNRCKKSFQLSYTYHAHKPGVKEQILEQILNSSGVRDISCNVKIDKNTVIHTLRKKATPSEPLFA